MNEIDSFTRQQRDQQCPESGWRRELYIIIFEADTPLGKLFDVGLLIAIVASIAVISLETVSGLETKYSRTFGALEWVFTFLFTVEYVMRLICVRNPLRYVFSFWGIVDLLSFMPSYFFLLFGTDTGSFAMVRSLRLLRVFRVLKLLRLMSEADALYQAIWESREKIVVFFFTIMIAVTLSATLMYEIENRFFIADSSGAASGTQTQSKFTSIPESMYWAIVTMTTVGYGDVVPQTAAGKAISALLILLGYSLIIVPTGFVTAKWSGNRSSADGSPPRCEKCGCDKLPADANFCHRCGEKIEI